MWSFIVVAASVNASPLSVSGSVDYFLSSLSSRSTVKGDDLTDSRFLDTALIASRPPVYEISFRPVTADEISRVAGEAGIPDSLKKFAGYDEERGILYYNSPHIKPLSDESASGLEELQQKASAMLERLLGNESRRFVFANTETDWAVQKPETAPRRIMQTLRFTRKINGCHIIDNSSYVRIAFTGNGELCGFEIRNPDLHPVACERMVKPSATKGRLEQFAAAKNTVRGSLNEEVKTTSIAAEKAIQSYISSSWGGKNRLIPCVSIWCRYSLENGETFEKFENFIIDASHVSNIDDDMLEAPGR
jgi:hypothetical protein